MCCSPTTRLAYAVTTGATLATTACSCPVCPTEGTFTANTLTAALLTDTPAFTRLAHP